MAKRNARSYYETDDTYVNHVATAGRVGRGHVTEVSAPDGGDIETARRRLASVKLTRSWVYHDSKMTPRVVKALA